MKPDDWVISWRTNLCQTILNCKKCCIMGRAVLLNRNTVRQFSCEVLFSAWLDPTWFSIAISVVDQLLAFGVDILDDITSTCFYIVYSLFILMLLIKVYLPHASTLMVIYPFSYSLRELGSLPKLGFCVTVQTLVFQFVGGSLLTGKGEKGEERSLSWGQCITLCRKLSGQELKCFHYSRAGTHSVGSEMLDILPTCLAHPKFWSFEK